MGEWNGPTKNYTKTPNAVLDAMPLMGEAELRVTLAITRATNGWGEEWAGLSLTDIMQISGLGKQPTHNGIQAGIERGTIERLPDKNSFKYRLLTNEYREDKTVNVVDQSGQASRPIESTADNQNGQRSRPQTVNVVDQSEQETVKQVDQSDAPYKEPKDTKEKDTGKTKSSATASPPARASVKTETAPCPKCRKPFKTVPSGNETLVNCPKHGFQPIGAPVEARKSKRKARAPNHPYYFAFAEEYAVRKKFKYVCDVGDEVQFKKMLEDRGDELTAERWAVAVRNFFDSPLDEHSLKRLCTRVAEYWNNPINEFNKPAGVNGNGKSRIASGNRGAHYAQESASVSEAAINPESIRSKTQLGKRPGES